MEISRNTDVENPDPTRDCSQSDPPEAEFSVRQSCNSFDSDPEEASHRPKKQKTLFLFVHLFFDSLSKEWSSSVGKLNKSLNKPN